ncbi:putative serine racemase [Pseudolycoriella hygida]|uniref:L-serine deaminase n=1 Tax=Pseudolycoriella hygida TaxID=35572 RepID=A0A9Q0NCV1_9DIPT|nr:putative serine racemase [Pseudolycoriella hygida]
MAFSLSMPTIEEIYAAQSRLQGIAIRTPLVKLNYDIPGLEIYLKCEQFQPISSFKIRGAANAIQILSKEEKKNGIVVASAGNMAQGVAWMARREQINCEIIVPDTVNQVKLNEIERLGGKITKCSFEEWWKVIVTHQCPMLKGHFIHPVCDQNVIAGHGTIALEILEDLPDCDAILVPFGGVALVTGVAFAAKQKKPTIEVLACEVETAAPLAAAFKANRVVNIPMIQSWVDGIGSSSVLDEMWPFVKSYVDDSIVVTLSEAAKALKILIERSHVICEGASATTIAASLWHYMNLVENGRAKLKRAQKAGKIKIVAVLSGGAIDNENIIKCLNGTL